MFNAGGQTEIFAGTPRTVADEEIHISNSLAAETAMYTRFRDYSKADGQVAKIKFSPTEAVCGRTFPRPTVNTQSLAGKDDWDDASIVLQRQEVLQLYSFTSFADVTLVNKCYWTMKRGMISVSAI